MAPGRRWHQDRQAVILNFDDRLPAQIALVIRHKDAPPHKHGNGCTQAGTPKRARTEAKACNQ